MECRKGWSRQRRRTGGLRYRACGMEAAATAKEAVVDGAAGWAERAAVVAVQGEADPVAVRAAVVAVV